MSELPKECPVCGQGRYGVDNFNDKCPVVMYLCGKMAMLSEDGQTVSLHRNCDRAESLVADLRASLAAVTKERDEARKYGAPVGDAVAIVKKKKPCNHNDYWVTHSGHCMACRATEAESRLAIAVGALEKITSPYGHWNGFHEPQAVAEAALREIKGATRDRR